MSISRITERIVFPLNTDTPFGPTASSIKSLLAPFGAYNFVWGAHKNSSSTIEMLHDWPSKTVQEALSNGDCGANAGALSGIMAPHLAGPSKKVDIMFPVDSDHGTILASKKVQLVTIKGVHDLCRVREDVGAFVAGWGTDVWGKGVHGRVVLGEVLEDEKAMRDEDRVGRTDGLENGARVVVVVGMEGEGKDPICGDAWREFVIEGRRGRDVEVVDMVMNGIDGKW